MSQPLDSCARNRPSAPSTRVSRSRSPTAAIAPQSPAPPQAPSRDDRVASDRRAAAVSLDEAIRFEPANGWRAVVRRHPNERPAIDGAARRYEGMGDVDLGAADRFDRAGQPGAVVAGDREAAGDRSGRPVVVEDEVEAHLGDVLRRRLVQISGADRRRIGNAHGGALQAVVVAVHRHEVPFDVPPARTPRVIALAAHLERALLAGDAVAAARPDGLLEAAGGVAGGAVTGERVLPERVRGADGFDVELDRDR